MVARASVWGVSPGGRLCATCRGLQLPTEEWIRALLERYPPGLTLTEIARIWRRYCCRPPEDHRRISPHVNDEKNDARKLRSVLERIAIADESRGESTSRAKRVVVDKASPSGVGPHWTTVAWMEITHQTDRSPSGWGLIPPKTYRDFQGGLLEEVGLPLGWFVLNCVGAQQDGLSEDEIAYRVRIAIKRVVKSNHDVLSRESYSDLMQAEQLIRETFEADGPSLREWEEEVEPVLPEGTLRSFLIGDTRRFKSMIHRQLKQPDVKGLAHNLLDEGDFDRIPAP